MPKIRGAEAKAIRTAVLASFLAGEALSTDQKHENTMAKKTALNLLQKKEKWAKELAEHSENRLKLSVVQLRRRKSFIARGKIGILFVHDAIFNFRVTFRQLTLRLKLARTTSGAV